MNPRRRAIRCRVVRDSHAKCVRIYRTAPSADAILCGFQAKFAVAPTLLLIGKGLGRNQPFDPGTMNVTQAAAAKLCPAPADRAALPCPESSRPLIVSSWRLSSFRPSIRLSLGTSPREETWNSFHEPGSFSSSSSKRGDKDPGRGRRPRTRRRFMVPMRDFEVVETFHEPSNNFRAAKNGRGPLTPTLSPAEGERVNCLRSACKYRFPLSTCGRKRNGGSHVKRRATSRCPQLRGVRATGNQSLHLAEEFFATRNFPGVVVKRLARSRARVL